MLYTIYIGRFHTYNVVIGESQCKYNDISCIEPYLLIIYIIVSMSFLHSL